MSARIEHARDASLLAALRNRLRGRVVVMGIGNPLRGDDAVGCTVARELRAWREPPPSRSDQWSATVLEAEEVPENWLGPAVAARPNVVLLLDAVELGEAPGSVALLEPGELRGPAVFTHRTSLATVARYLASETGADVLLLGIQPGHLRWGDELSDEVHAAAADLVLLLSDVLDGAGNAGSGTETNPC